MTPNELAVHFYTDTYTLTKEKKGSKKDILDKTKSKWRLVYASPIAMLKAHQFTQAFWGSLSVFKS